MREQQNLRLVQQFYAAFQRGDIAGVLNAFADDVALYPAPKEIIPFVGRRQGREASATPVEFLATALAGPPMLNSRIPGTMMTARGRRPFSSMAKRSASERLIKRPPHSPA